MDIFDRYGEEVKEDAAIDEINVKDVSMRLPGIKHKWVARLIKHKREVYKLEKEKEAMVEAAMKRLKEKSDLQLSNKAMTHKLSGTDTIRALDNKIADERAVVDYLEHVEQIFRYMTNDVGNVIKIMNMELN